MAAEFIHKFSAAAIQWRVLWFLRSPGVTAQTPPALRAQTITYPNVHRREVEDAMAVTLKNVHGTRQAMQTLPHTYNRRS